jgi:DNA processing protein
MASRAPCPECTRRCWLLGVLSVRLDCRSRDETRLLELLELEDDDLIDAIAGRRRREIRHAWKRFVAEGFGAEGLSLERHGVPRGAHGAQLGAQTPNTGADRHRIETVCRHSRCYPEALRGIVGGPQMLHVHGGSERLANLAVRPTVAIVGTAKPTDYGMEMARGLARGLSASGVTIVSALASGIAAAALAGAQETGGSALVVVAGGLDAAVPASRRGVYETLMTNGCAISELEGAEPRRRWAAIAGRRAVAGLAKLTVVVEAGEGAAELRNAQIAKELGRTVAAMPGRVTSPASIGTNLMLRDGAPLVRDAADALELLSELGVEARGGWRPRPDGSEADGTGKIQQDSEKQRAGDAGPHELEPRLKTILERVGAGLDTPGKLTEPGEDAGEIMLALAELEVMGLLNRGDGGRYVPRQSLTAART